MTPNELARLTGYSRQTINKWVRKEGWTTSPKPGVQGGKADWFTSMNRFVNIFAMLNVQKVREKRLPFLVTLAKEMTPVEQKQFTSLLLREGIIGLLQRLGIRDSK
nr:hypothetical protein 105 - Escherichia coli [Escherichia coli]